MSSFFLGKMLWCGGFLRLYVELWNHPEFSLLGVFLLLFFAANKEVRIEPQ